DLLNNLDQYKIQYAGISFLVLCADIILPVPSSIVMYLNGYILGIPNGALVSLIALMIGSIIGYFLGKLTSAGFKATTDEKANNLLAKYGAIAILMSRGIPMISESICIVCGYNKMPMKQYILFNFIGYIPLCILYAVCGSFGYSQDMFLLSFGFSLVISAAFWFLGKAFFVNSQNVKAD
ncbi:MAG: VTT domain-containing protein, partial [Bacteroidetes bacterium]|nr:VTT domain-containing protein [Bacteroidota bacterium]